MKIKATVYKNSLRFGNPIAAQRFYEQYEGKHVLIEADEKPSAQKRRYFEGCIVPVVFYAHPQSGWDNFGDAREAVKLEFLGVEKKDLHGKTFRVARFTTTLSNVKFAQFLEAVTGWLRENVMVPEECFDPEAWKIWRDTGQDDFPIYPPLARLKERYDRGKYGHDAQGALPGEGLERGK